MSNGNNFHFTFNFHAPVGQQISHVEKLETHFDKDMSMQVIDTGAVMNAHDDEEEPLRNYIFQERIFNTNERLVRLRNTIASAIDMGEESALYGTPQEKRIHPHARNEWYYIVKAIEESEISKPFAITHFVEQMMEWYPHLFLCDAGEEREAFKRRLSKAISDEKGAWKHGRMKEVISLADMWAKRNQLGLDTAKMERIYAIAYKGLYQNLKALKQSITQEKSR